MPLKISQTAAGDTTYGDIRVGSVHGIHQIKANAAGLAASRDAMGVLPPGLPIKADGTPVTGAGQVVKGLVGPEPAPLGGADDFVNVILTGPVNRSMIEANLGRVLSANELAALPAVLVLM